MSEKDTESSVASGATSVGGAPPASSSGNADSGSGNAGMSKRVEKSLQEALLRFAKIVNSFLVRPDSGPFREPVDWRGLELYDYPEVIKKQMDLGTVKRKLERKQYVNAAAAAYDVRLVWRNCMTYNTVGSDFWLLAKAYNKRFEDRYRRIRNEFHVGEDPVFSDDEPDEVEQSAEEMDDDADDDDLKDNNHKEDGDGDEESDASGGSPDVGAYKKQKRSSKSKHNNTPPPPASVKLDMRAKFASNLLLLNGMDLGHVIDILERECPEALESIGQQQHQQHPKPTLPDRLEINLDKIELGDVFQKVSTYAAEHARARKRTAPPPPKIKDVSNRRRDRK